MPPPKLKQTKGNPAKKEQIAEKVKEIQQRQKNWLRQRDQHMNSAPEPISKEASTNGKHWTSAETKRTADRKAPGQHTSHGADILKVHHDSSSQLASQVSDKLNVNVKHGFGSWLQSRKQAGDDAENENNSNGRSSETYSGDPSSTVGSTLRQSNRSYPLSPAEFDTLADSIAAKVKKDLGIKNGHGPRLHDGAETRGERLGQGGMLERGSETEQTFGRGAGDSCDVGGDGDGNVDISSHRCPFCSSLMVVSAHAPMLLFPCGHTVCKRCSSSHTSCRLCGTRVGSQTANIMLQQIIQQFHSRAGHSQGSTDTAHSTRDNHHHQGTSSAVPPPKTAVKQRDVNYAQQLQSLQERQSTLQEESRSRRREVERAARSVQRAQQQVDAITREEDSLERQLQQLQEKLQSLREHREEYSRECQQLQEEQRAAEEQAALVDQCLKSLGEEIDKVQFLAEGQEETYFHQQSQYR